MAFLLWESPKSNGSKKTNGREGEGGRGRKRSDSDLFSLLLSICLETPLDKRIPINRTTYI